MTDTYVLRDQRITDNCCTEIVKRYQDMARQSKGKLWVVTIKHETRRSIQNARHWAIISDFAQQVPNQAGKFYLPEQWHELFKAWFIGQIELPDGRYIPMSSKDLTVKQFSEFSMKVEDWLTSQGYEIKEV
jgi:hypothetical protein